MTGTRSQNTRNNHSDENGPTENQPSMAEILASMERSRQQAEANQARMMETQAKMLEQIASKLATQGQGTGIAQEESEKSRWSDFQKTHPPTFSGSSQPLDADDWLRDVERKLETI